MEMLSFLPLINNSVTIGLSFLLLSISEIVSKTINILHFRFTFTDCTLQYFYHLSTILSEYSIKVLVV